MGPMGRQGIPGPVGPAGPTGTKGEQDPQGEKDERGDVGPQGRTGPTGPQGSSGPIGAQGETGAITKVEIDAVSAGEVPHVTARQTDTGVLLDFMIPAAVTGLQGEKGERGV